jgi:hypothetical protein
VCKHLHIFFPRQHSVLNFLLFFLNLELNDIILVSVHEQSGQRKFKLRRAWVKKTISFRRQDYGFFLKKNKNRMQEQYCKVAGCERVHERRGAIYIYFPQTKSNPHRFVNCLNTNVSERLVAGTSPSLFCLIAPGRRPLMKPQGQKTKDQVT